MSHKKCISLPKIIIFDLLNYGLMIMILFFLILFSSMLIVHVTYKTRLLITQYEKLITDKNALNFKFNCLFLQYHALHSKNRIEYEAINNIQMQHLNKENQNIVIP